jgi:hypothetical protein
MTSMSEISLVRVGATAEGAAGDEPSPAVWSPVQAPRSGRPSPGMLVALALVAGIGAMGLAALAVLSAARSGDDGAPVTPSTGSTPVADASSVERRVLALLAKPSTDRVPFRGSGGRLVLAVGSGGRAAILARGRGPWSAGPSYAWVVRSGKAVRAARLTASDRAVFLSAPVRRGDALVVAADRASALQGASRLIAVRS